jgi:O-acetyl-ADP-ribose deacetylase (regulator of RNase III)
MTGPVEIDVWQGDLAELEVDALVVGANESLFMTVGAAASVKRRGGLEVERAAVDQGPIAPGGAVVTAGGRLAAPYVIHAVAVGHDRIADPDRLRSAVAAALAFVGPLQLHRIAVALIGVEHGVFSPSAAADALVPALIAGSAGTQLKSIVIATPHFAEARAAAEAVARQRASAR